MVRARLAASADAIALGVERLRALTERALAGLTTHVLDLTRGGPAPGVRIELYELGKDGDRRLVASTTTNADGRTDKPLIAGDGRARRRVRTRFPRGRLFSRCGRQTGRPAVPRRRADPLRHRRSGRALPRAPARLAVELFDLPGKLRARAILQVPRANGPSTSTPSARAAPASFRSRSAISRIFRASCQNSEGTGGRPESPAMMASAESLREEARPPPSRRRPPGSFAACAFSPPRQNLFSCDGLRAAACGPRFGEDTLKVARLLDSSRARDRIVAVRDDDVFPGLNPGKELREMGFRLTDLNGDGS